MYGDEFSRFFLIPFGSPPYLCPYCSTETIKTLWIGDPDHLIDGKMRAQWYRWCESCLLGIYSPPGTYVVPEGEPFIYAGDQEALSRALPMGLRLIRPNPKAHGKEQKPQ